MSVMRLPVCVRAAFDAACSRRGGEPIEESQAADFWNGLRDARDEFFLGARAACELDAGATLWRLSLAPGAAADGRSDCTAPASSWSNGATVSAGGASPRRPLARIPREFKRELGPAGSTRLRTPAAACAGPNPCP